MGRSKVADGPTHTTAIGKGLSLAAQSWWRSCCARYGWEVTAVSCHSSHGCGQRNRFCRFAL